MSSTLHNHAPARRLAVAAAMMTAFLGSASVSMAQEYYSAPVVDPTLHNPPAAQSAPAPRYGYLTQQELRAKAAQLTAQQEEIRTAQNAVTTELARRGADVMARQ